MRFELLLILIAGLIMANIYTDGKYLKLLFTYKKYYQIISYFYFSFVFFKYFKLIRKKLLQRFDH